jgi:hypothetical protein
VVWEERTGIVVMLIKEIERGQERTAIYWPTKGATMRIGGFSLSLVRSALATCLAGPCLHLHAHICINIYIYIYMYMHTHTHTTHTTQ